jgi:hypothetical protein
MPTRWPGSAKACASVTSNGSGIAGRHGYRRPFTVDDRLRGYLPNGTTGWVPRSALGGSVLLDTAWSCTLSALRVTLFRGGEQVLAVPIGVGQARWPTRTGEFYVRDIVTCYLSPTYGTGRSRLAPAHVRRS